MLTDAQVIVQWRRRRSDAWRAIRIALAALFISGAAFWYLARTPASDMNGAQLLICVLLLFVLGIATLLVIFRTNRLYRCPRCNTVPMGNWSTLGPSSFGFESGVALNPKRCSKCGALLREPE